MPPRHVYVHVPFCARRCAYCDFSIAVRSAVPAAEYQSALARELSLRCPPGEAWPLETLYLGGGTPSRLGGPGLAAVVLMLRERFHLEPGAEVTIEANPEDVTPSAVRAWRSAGVTRLSLGAQSFDEGALRWMHRTHSPEQTTAAVRAARGEGIEELSIDLIFALPDALGRDWRRDLDAAVGLSPQHVSLYGLTIEPRTPLARWRDRGAVTESPEERYEEEFLTAHERLSGAGFEHYEVSNYALPGHRARHNSSYWRRSPYLGLGPSAHSFDGSRRSWNVSAYAEWARTLDRGDDPREAHEDLGAEEVQAEAVYLGLRTREGLPSAAFPPDILSRWAEAGWAGVEGEQLRLTPSGWLRLDALAGALTVSGSRYYI